MDERTDGTTRPRLVLQVADVRVGPWSSVDDASAFDEDEGTGRGRRGSTATPGPSPARMRDSEVEAPTPMAREGPIPGFGIGLYPALDHLVTCDNDAADAGEGLVGDNGQPISCDS